MKPFISMLAMAACLVLNGRAAAPDFTTRDGRFLLNGQPFQIISGEMHYPRIPRAYWRDRFRMARAMGLNTVTTYVFWNEHEPRPGVYDFSGNNDIAEFVREAQQEGLYVILRPGPYVCAEWEFGGFPSWLLKDHSLVVRSRDPKFMTAVERWIHRLGQELAPLQIGNGGPIIAVQVENEYGSFGDDRTYMQQMHHLLTESGFNRSLLYTADGPEELPKGSLPGLPVGINFGGDSANAAQESFAMLRKFRSDGPSLNSEYWDGWFDHWGGAHASTNTANQAANLSWMLARGYSVSLYMFHGGTSFGWMNGANSNGKNYEPDVTSYDYDSPLDESGRPTPKYFVFRDLIQKTTGVAAPAVPEVPPAIAAPAFTLSESVSLWSTLPVPVHSDQLLSMEDLDQSYGYILYRTHVAGPVSGDLVLDELHDYAQIYVNGKLAGALDRRLAQNTLHLDLTGADSRLDILIENSGRVNFTAVLRGERKGITRQVTFAGKQIEGWDIYTLPMTNASNLAYSNGPCEGACFYRATFDVDQRADTFLDTGGLGKGQVWLNGRPLGRVWSIGPQKTLYVPGPWLNQGKNEIVVFDLNGHPGLTLKCWDKPNLGPTTPSK